MYKSRGNWAEDLGHSIEFAFKLLVGLIILTPILLGVIVYLIVAK